MIEKSLELSQKYGFKFFFMVAIVFLYNMNLKQEKKIESIEARLYDCLEDKQQFHRSANNKLIIRNPLLAILPNEKNTKIRKKADI